MTDGGVHQGKHLLIWYGDKLTDELQVLCLTSLAMERCKVFEPFVPLSQPPRDEIMQEYLFNYKWWKYLQRAHGFQLYAIRY